MIPYFEIHRIFFGPIPIQVWGFFVALGLLAGLLLSIRLAKQRHQDPALFWDLAFWVILNAFLFARLFHVVLYEPGYFLANPWQVFALWDGGASIIGGLFGAAVAGVWYLRHQRVDVWSHIDTGVFGLPLGLFIGRIGCFLIHDHPGTATDFILGVRYPDGVVRHDLGLYESLNGLALLLMFLALSRTKPRPGTYTVVFLIWYGVTRFLFDFLRATNGPIVDARYLGLTPAQFVAIIMVGVGVWLVQKYKLSAKN